MRSLLLTVLAILVLPHATLAASLNFGSNSFVPKVGEPTEVTLSVDSEGLSINAIEGEIIIPEGMDVLLVRYGSSIISVWIEQPKLISKTISFSGIIPGGWSGVAGKSAPVLTLVLRARNVGEYLISLDSKTHVLLNDGLGTVSPLKSSTLILHALPSTGEVGTYTFIDEISPDPFTPLISRSDELFNGDYFVVFNSTDRESGLSHYEIAESRRWVDRSHLKWRPAISPERLDDQTLSSTVYIKAVDQAGNERISIISPANRYYTIVALIFSIVLLFMFIHFREYLRRILSALTGYTN